MQVEHVYVGTASLEETLSSILRNLFDSNAASLYDEKRANVIPSDTEGAAK
jgi:hypothetical protein